MDKSEYFIPKDEERIDPNDVPWWTSSRLGLAVLGFFGFVNVYTIRVNLSMAIVCMVNGTAIRLRKQAQNESGGSSQPFDSSCGFHSISNYSSNKEFEDGEFVWDKTTQGLVLGSFFWGYLVTQIPGGWIATAFGGKRVFGISMAAATVCTFLTPIAARTSYVFLMVIRILLGIFSGTCFPSMHAIWGNWAPPLERSKLVSFAYAGAQAGIVVTFPIASLLCKYGFAGGWPSIFYVLGTTNLIWVILWMIIASDSPAAHKRISDLEKKYIQQSLGDSIQRQTGKRLEVPWKKIVLSPPVYAIILCNMASDWGSYTLLTNIPTYMKEVLKLDITSNGLYSALPYIGFWAMINMSGWFADFIQKYVTRTTTRKICEACGKFIPAINLIGLGYLDCSMTTLAIALLTFGVTMSGMQFNGYLVNTMDVAPPFAGILFGISNSMGAMTGFISPTVVGLITEHGQTRSEWQKVFYIATSIYIACGLFYLVFGTGELQKWARVEKSNEENPETKELQESVIT